MRTSDTIAAVATVPAAGGRIVLRTTGPASRDVAEALCGVRLTHGAVRRVRLRPIDGLTCPVPATLLAFVAPGGPIGQDVIEYALPGSPPIADAVLATLLKRGCRAAEPGEFTARAFFNGKLDLAAAEGVAAIIAARNDADLAAARRLAAGELSRRLRPIQDDLADTLTLVEAGIDFADEGVSPLSPGTLRRRTDALLAACDDLLTESSRLSPPGRVPTVAFVGRPNAGKSTLLNALAGSSRAVVSPVAGTTRDVLTVDVTLRRGVVTLIDTAGLDAEPPPGDGLAVHAADAARDAVATADVIVVVRAVDDPLPPPPLRRAADVTLVTKTDLALGSPSHTVAYPSMAVFLSVHAGIGLEAVQDRLDRLTFGDPAAPRTFAMAARHRRDVAAAADALRRVRDAIDSRSAVPDELLAFDLRDALNALGRVVGAVTPDDLLGRVFAGFCIGK